MAKHNPITPANEEQANAIAKSIAFVREGNHDEFFLVAGKAGTGKTTIAQAVIEQFIGRKRILVCAIAHKAKMVIADKIEQAFGPNKVTAKSVAGALGMGMDLETGDFFVPNGRVDTPIRNADIIIVDEASMINEMALELIMGQKKETAAVIFLGDIRQLPPIRKKEDRKSDKPSPVFTEAFKTGNFCVLNERIRQGEESPILPYADYWGDNSKQQYPVLMPAPSTAETISDKGCLVFANSMSSVIDAVMPLYEMAVDTGNTNLIKTVCYTNDTRNEINDEIRSRLFPTNEKYIKGDLLIFDDNYELESGELISNGFEFQVLKSRQTKKYDYVVWEIEFVYDEFPESAFVLHPREVARFKKECNVEALAKKGHLKDKCSALAQSFIVSQKFNLQRQAPFLPMQC